MKGLLVIACMCIAIAAKAAEPAPLLEMTDVAALANELSGEMAKRNLEVISQSHRSRASQGFRTAAEHVATQLRAYGLEDVEILHFPADGKTTFGTQKSRLAWDVKSAQLWEMAKDNASWIRAVRSADWESVPLSVAEDSDQAEVTADLVDVGAGTRDADYKIKSVRGKLVLVSAQPEEAQAFAVDRYGAAGIVSYAQNQKTAWWGENADLLRWGHLDSFPTHPTFAFMVRPSQAKVWQARLAAGETVRLQASVDGGRHAGSYDIVSARIPGSHPLLAAQEIAFTCHLDHPHPGANDNASGCATILEVARTFAALIREGKLARPVRTLRFYWPPEVEGSTILLNARPDLARKIGAAIHLDMVGGGPDTKAVFRVTRSPASLPTFVNDVAETIAEYVNAQTLGFASGESPTHSLTAPEGGKEPLLAHLDEFTPGSDHVVLTDGAFRIPSIYLNDWPDRFIHTDRDVPANIDPTKLKRAGFIAASSAWYLANLHSADVGGLLELLNQKRLVRTARMLGRRAALSSDDAAALARFHWQFERAMVDSISAFAPLSATQRDATSRQIEGLSQMYGDGGAASRSSGTAAVIYRRNADPKGPMAVFGYDYVAAHIGKARAAALRLPAYEGLRGSGASYTIEALNFVDGKRTVQDIRDSLTAEFGPVQVDLVAEYLSALESIGVLHR